VILTLRTWAVWDRNPRLTVILLSFYVLLWFPTYILGGVFVNSMKCKWSDSYLRLSGSFMIYLVVVGDPPYPGFQGCFLSQSMNIRYLTFLWVQLAFWDTRKCIHAFNISRLIERQ
jgi:hypothetical protein